MWICKKCGTSLDDDQEKCKFCGFEINPHVPPDKSLKNLQTTSNLILAIGVICSVLLAIFGFIILKNGDKATAIYLFVSIIPALLPSIAYWALATVIRNIYQKVIDINKTKSSTTVK